LLGPTPPELEPLLEPPLDDPELLLPDPELDPLLEPPLDDPELPLDPLLLPDPELDPPQPSPCGSNRPPRGVTA